MAKGLCREYVLKTLLLVAGMTASGKGTVAAWRKERDPQIPVYRFSDPLRDLYFNMLTDFHLCAEEKLRLFPKEPTALHHERLCALLVRTFGPFIRERMRYRALERFDTWLREEFARGRDPWSKRASTPDLQDLSTAVRNFFGDDLLAHALKERVGLSTHRNSVVEGVRLLIDIETLLFGATKYRPIFLYVEAPQPLRYKWFLSRNEKAGDANVSYPEFRKLNRAEPERQIPLLRKYAHHRIRNMGTKEEFVAKLDAIAKKEGIA